MTPNEFRELALDLPGAVEGSHMGHPDFRVNKKVFASLGPDLSWGMAKLTPPQQAAFMAREPSLRPAAGKWGERGATVISLIGASIEITRDALEAAWGNIAEPNSSRSL